MQHFSKQSRLGMSVFCSAPVRFRSLEVINHKTKGETNEGNIRKFQKDTRVQKTRSFANENGDESIADAVKRPKVVGRQRRRFVKR